MSSVVFGEVKNWIQKEYTNIWNFLKSDYGLVLLNILLMATGFKLIYMVLEVLLIIVFKLITVGINLYRNSDIVDDYTELQDWQDIVIQLIHQ